MAEEMMRTARTLNMSPVEHPSAVRMSLADQEAERKAKAEAEELEAKKAKLAQRARDQAYRAKLKESQGGRVIDELAQAEQAVKNGEPMVITVGTVGALTVANAGGAIREVEFAIATPRGFFGSLSRAARFPDSAKVEFKSFSGLLPLKDEATSSLAADLSQKKSVSEVEQRLTTDLSAFTTREEWFADVQANPNGQAAQEQRALQDATWSREKEREFLARQSKAWRETLAQRKAESPEERLRREFFDAPKVKVYAESEQVVQINDISYRIPRGESMVPQPFANIFLQAQKDRREASFINTTSVSGKRW